MEVNITANIFYTIIISGVGIWIGDRIVYPRHVLTGDMVMFLSAFNLIAFGEIYGIQIMGLLLSAVFLVKMITDQLQTKEEEAENKQGYSIIKGLKDEEDE